MHRITLAIAIGLTVVFSLISFTQVCADDFSLLLSELDFDNQPASSQTLGVANPQAAEALRPVPTGFVMPDSAAVTLQAPIARRQPATESLSMSAASAVGQMKSRSGDIAANSVGLRLGGHRHADSSCDCDACDAAPQPRQRMRLPKLPCKSGCSSGCGEILDASCGCDNGCRREKHVEQKVCMPRNEVNLPSSTLRQYFRSNRCYTNVWDGYSQECGDNHKHIHGTCDCGTKKQRNCLSGHCGGGCGEILPPRQACNDSGSCDGGCSR